MMPFISLSWRNSKLTNTICLYSPSSPSYWVYFTPPPAFAINVFILRLPLVLQRLLLGTQLSFQPSKSSHTPPSTPLKHLILHSLLSFFLTALSILLFVNNSKFLLFFKQSCTTWRENVIQDRIQLWYYTVKDSLMAFLTLIFLDDYNHSFIFEQDEGWGTHAVMETTCSLLSLIPDPSIPSRIFIMLRLFAGCKGLVILWWEKYF